MRACGATAGMLLLATLGAIEVAPASAAPATAAPATPHRGSAEAGATVTRHDGVLSYRDVRLAARPTVPVTGTLRVVPGEAGRPTRYGVTTHGVTLPIALEHTTGVRSGSRFVGRLVAEPGTSTSRLRTRTSPVLTATVTPRSAPTVRRMFVAVVTNLGTVPTDAKVLASAQKTADYWKEQSSGTLTSFTRSATVLHYKTAYDDPQDCGLGSDVFDFADEARAKFSGLHAGDTVSVFVPETCADAGPVGVSTGGVTVNVDGIWLDNVVGHEEGHELGIDHANLRACYDGACSDDEYGDLTSIMGLAFSWNGEEINQHTAVNTLFRSVLGFTQPGEVQSVTLPAGQTTTTVETTLQPRASTTGRRGLRIPDPDSQDVWFVEYRHATGRDVASAYDIPLSYVLDFRRGVSVLQQKHNRPDASLMLGVGPVDPDTQSNGSALAAGQSWTSTDGRLKVEFLTDAGASGATVRITVTSHKPPLASTKPVVTGIAEAGLPLTAKTGTWTTGTAFGYRWLVDGTAVPGATKSGYTPVVGDVGKSVAVEVTGTKAGYATTVRTSDPIGPVAASSWTPQQPTISAPRVGARVTVTPGSWGSGATFSYQWYAGSTAISKATRATYTPIARQVGKRLSVRVTGRKPGYPTASRTSAGVVVAKGVLATAVPSISGTPKVGKVLTGRHGTWTAGTTFSYRWFADGAAISKATHRTFTVRGGQVGKAITLRVTGRRTGYTTASATSAATAAVVR